MTLKGFTLKKRVKFRYKKGWESKIDKIALHDFWLAPEWAVLEVKTLIVEKGSNFLAQLMISIVKRPRINLNRKINFQKGVARINETKFASHSIKNLKKQKKICRKSKKNQYRNILKN